MTEYFNLQIWEKVEKITKLKLDKNDVFKSANLILKNNKSDLNLAKEIIKTQYNFEETIT
tara:strand:+ start:711 stop:890 length:180 start_codon:yes stop_codon:yes gene_type:complete